jgi:hypothetical protein
MYDAHVRARVAEGLGKRSPGPAIREADFEARVVTDSSTKRMQIHTYLQTLF